MSLYYFRGRRKTKLTTPFNFFSNIFCINLDTRPDRWKSFQKETDIYNMGVERISGVVYTGHADRHRNACTGNHLAHAECIKKAKQDDASNVLIFEDDVNFFLGKIPTEEVLQHAIESLPSNWGLFYLGINMDVFKAHRYGNYLAKIDGGFSTHAYAINSYLFDTIIRANEDVNLIHNDVWYSQNIHTHYPCFVSNPLLCGQRTDYSDIQGIVMNSNRVFLERFKNNLI